MSKAKQRLRVVSPAFCLSGLLSLGGVAGCGDDGMDMTMMMMPPPPPPPPKVNPFTPVPECTGPSIDFRKGQKTVVIAGLEIAAQTQGFDLDKDGKIDNKLGAISSLANSELESVFTERHDIIIPIEFFGPTAGDASCTKFALYLGQFNQDRDQDNADTTWESDSNAAKGDCNDQEKTVRPGAAEDVNNRMDDDCDGLADNPTKKMPATGMSAMMDLDGDGVSVADGDCDDRANSPMVPTDTGPVPLATLRHPAKMGSPITAGIERCDGIDYNCDGIPTTPRAAIRSATTTSSSTCRSCP